jgi:hypothetical protein
VGFGYSSIAPSNTSIAQTVWSYGPRTLTDIQSLVNAITNNDPSLLSTLGDLPFIPAPMYAGQVSLTQVASFISNLVQNYNAAGVIASFINSDPYSLWGMDFVINLIQNPALGFTNASLILSAASSSVLASIAISTNVPVTTILALISNAALSATAAQGLLYGLANNYYYNKWLQVVTYNAPTSVTFSTNTVISTAVLIAQNITISSGVTVTCGTTTCFFVAQVFNNQGTVAAYGVGGSNNYASGGGGGGTGGGGVVVIAYTAAVGTINVNGSPGQPGVAATGAGITGGFSGGTGLFLLLSGMSVPSGGTSPGCAADVYGLPCYNGGAGGAGAFSNFCYNNSVVYSFPNGNDLVTYVIQSVGDWWLSNVVGKAPPSVTPLPMVQGSGGGGGEGSNATGVVGGGGGGGGGGEAIIYGYNVIAGTINAAGGIGGTGCNTGGCCSVTGGGGGGGGIALVFYGPGGLNGTMAYNVAGGSGGYWSTGSYALAGANGTYYAGSVTVNG